MVLDLNKDKKGSRSKTHSNSVKTLQSFITELSLVDAWRVLNPDISRHTWRRKNPEIQCRLDFFLVSQSMMSNITQADILCGYKTDHSMITINTALHSNPRGPSFWKMNTSFLTDVNYVNQIRTTIREVLSEYKNDTSVNPSLLWEMIKLKIREQSLKYAADRKANMLRKEEELEKRINILQTLIESEVTGEQEKVDAWNDISVFLLNAINYAFDRKQLSVSQRRGIIKLIPKKDSDPSLIKNWIIKN